MSEEKKIYRVVLTTSDSEADTRKEISRVEFELSPIPGTELWQPKVSVHNQRTGFQVTVNFPRGFYVDLRAKLEKFNICNYLDLVVKGLTQLSSLIGEKPSK